MQERNMVLKSSSACSTSARNCSTAAQNGMELAQQSFHGFPSPSNDYKYHPKAVHEASPADSGTSSASAAFANACASRNAQQPDKHPARTNKNTPPTNSVHSYNSSSDPEVALWGHVLLSNQDPSMEGRSVQSFTEHELLADIYDSGTTSADQFVFGADHQLQASWAPPKFDLAPSYMQTLQVHHENGTQYREINSMDLEEPHSEDEGGYTMDTTHNKPDHDEAIANRAATPVEDRLSSTAPADVAAASSSREAMHCQTKLQSCAAGGDQQGQASASATGRPSVSSASSLQFLINNSNVGVRNNEPYNLGAPACDPSDQNLANCSANFHEFESMSTDLWSLHLFQPSSEHDQQHHAHYFGAGCNLSSASKLSAHHQRLDTLPLQQVHQSRNNVCGTAPLLLNPVSSYTNLLLEHDPPPLIRNVGASQSSFKLAAMPTNPIQMMVGCTTSEFPPALPTMVTQFPHPVFSAALDRADPSRKTTNYLPDYSNSNLAINECLVEATESISTTTTTCSSTLMDHVGMKRSSNALGTCSGVQTTQPCMSSCDNFSEYLVNSMDGTSAAAASGAAGCHIIKRPRVAEVSEVALTMPTTSKQAPKKEKLGDRIATLQQLVSPFGKTDTASVLLEAIGYIKFLQDQVQALSSPYMQKSSSGSQKTMVEGVRRPWGNLHVNPNHALLQKNASRSPTSTDETEDLDNGEGQDLRSRGLCLVPISCTLQVANAKIADYWSAAYSGVGASFRPF